MAKLLDLLVAAEGFAPVAGRVYAQDRDGRVARFGPQHGLVHSRVFGMWITDGGCIHAVTVPLADDYQTAVITAEAILAARGAECQ